MWDPNSRGPIIEPALLIGVLFFYVYVFAITNRLYSAIADLTAMATDNDTTYSPRQLRLTKEREKQFVSCPYILSLLRVIDTT
jgi:hypothetical protein